MCYSIYQLERDALSLPDEQTSEQACSGKTPANVGRSKVCLRMVGQPGTFGKVSVRLPEKSHYFVSPP